MNEASWKLKIKSGTKCDSGSLLSGKEPPLIKAAWSFFFYFFTSSKLSASWLLTALPSPSWDSVACLLRLSGEHKDNVWTCSRKSNQHVGGVTPTSCSCRWCTPESGTPGCATAPPETDADAVTWLHHRLAEVMWLVCGSPSCCRCRRSPGWAAQPLRSSAWFSHHRRWYTCHPAADTQTDVTGRSSASFHQAVTDWNPTWIHVCVSVDHLKLPDQSFVNDLNNKLTQSNLSEMQLLPSNYSSVFFCLH